ncbi:MAG: hypothetical protein H6623_03895 [Bdellovibrionaceae bacterium]|nr:hypothetical protein [Pseudobdellovibrionaceae bacterium]
MSDDRKVIPINSKFKKQVIKTTPNDLRAAATGTLAFILLLMVGFNFQIFETNNQELAGGNVSQRGLASIHKSMDPQWTKSLSQLGSQNIRYKGHRPSTLESLTYGYLQGNYSFNVEKGLVTNIQYSHDGQGQPQKMLNGAQFIKQYADVLVPQYVGISGSKREVLPGGIKETYTLKTASDEKAIEFQLDRNNGLMAVTVR